MSVTELTSLSIYFVYVKTISTHLVSTYITIRGIFRRYRGAIKKLII